MGLFTSINTAASGMSVQRLRNDVIANNIANVSTVRNEDGTPFRRSEVITRPIEEGPQWHSPYLPKSLDTGIGKGVRLVEIQVDRATENNYVYDPNHPDAIKSGPRAGFREMPNIDIVKEMVNMLDATRAYEANASVIEGSKSMFQTALDIGRR